MFANVAVLAGAPAKVVTVPRTAVTYSLYGDSVYVLKNLEGQPAPAKPEDTVYVVERRFVKSGQVREDRVAITDGPQGRRASRHHGAGEAVQRRPGKGRQLASIGATGRAAVSVRA